MSSTNTYSQHFLIDNKYTKWYVSLVESRKQLDRKFITNCGLEKHHIIPKSLGGNNGKDNIVVLTPKEHCLAHILLTKMYTGTAKGKMCYALIALSKARNKHRAKITSREYDSLRRALNIASQDPDFKKLRSENTKKQWTPERRAAVSAKAKQQWQQTNLREIFSSDEYKNKKSEQMKSRWLDPEYQKQQSDAAKTQWENNNFGRN